MLFTPLKIKEITFKNRIVVSPMCQYSATDGYVTDWHIVHLGSRAVGGAGLIMQEATAVCADGRISAGDLGIWKDEHIVPLKKITDFIASQGAVPGIQLAHAGRKASHAAPWQNKGEVVKIADGGWQTVAPSPIPYEANEPVPIEMTLADIKNCIEDFRAAAKRSVQAGFKVIEIHAAHGYLLNQFLSPLSNSRKDEYGGSFENRVKLLLEIVAAVKNEIQGLPLFVRISATDWVAGGWDVEDSIQLALLLKNAGVDLVDCSSGGSSPLQKIPVGPLYQVPLANKVKHGAQILTAAVGMITTAHEGEQILKNNEADLIFMARKLLSNPYFPLEAAKQLGVEIEWPKQYGRAK